LRHPCKFQRVSRLGNVTARHLVVGVSQTAALNRGRHLCSAGRPSRWALGHILVLSIFSSPNLSGRRLDIYHTLTHGVAIVRIYDAGLKRAARGSLKIQDAKNRHLCTIAQLCQAISSQLRHISTIEKIVKQRYVLQMSPRSGEHRPTRD